MSLIPSTNAGAPGQPYYVANDGTVQAPIIDAVGVVNFGPDANGDCFLRSAASAPTGAMALGANATDFNHLVLTSGPKLVSANAPIFATQGMSVSGATTFGGSVQFTSVVDMTQTAPSLRTYTQVGASIASGGEVALPQPAGLSTGLYSIALQCNAVPKAQLSVIAYWNGSSWVAGGATGSSVLGTPGSETYLNSNGANIVMYHNLASPLVINFIYYTQLSAAFS